MKRALAFLVRCYPLTTLYIAVVVTVILVLSLELE